MILELSTATIFYTYLHYFVRTYFTRWSSHFLSTMVGIDMAMNNNDIITSEFLALYT
jgi:hypothetical protein